MRKTVRFVGEKRVTEKLSQRLIQAGFQLHDSAEADVTITYCESLSSLEDTYFDTKGLIQAAPSGSFFIDLSASTPSFARELYAVAAVSDIRVIEAPLMIKDISCMDSLSHPENLFSFCAGSKEDIAQVEDILDAIYGNWSVLGEAGSAQLARCAFSLQTVALLVSLIESYALFDATKELQGTKMQDVWAPMLDGQNILVIRAKALLESIVTKNFSGEYTMRMFAAELAATLMAADDADLILPGAEASMHLFEILIIIGGADMVPASLSLIYGDEAGSITQGLDWSLIEDAFDQGNCFSYEDGNPYDGDYPQGFDAYSAN